MSLFSRISRSSSSSSSFNRLFSFYNFSRSFASKVTRYEIVPLTLYRIQAKLPVSLRSYDKQMELGRSSFDLKEIDGKVLPAEGETFNGPNGMSLRPASPVMLQILNAFRGTPTIYTLVCGLELPKDFIILHEHTDHYSLQVRKPMTLTEFNSKLTEFLKTLPSQTREQFNAAMEDEDDQDN